MSEPRRETAAPPRLDFVVIGAAKSGTTTLFHLLRHHPRIHLPPDKEVPFFSRDDWYERGWEWFAPRYLGEPGADQLVGTMSPQYMEDSRRTPRRLADHSPDLRLIALLRDPVERAFSMWRMMTRLQREADSFEAAIDEQIPAEALAAARRLDWTRTNTSDRYLVTGEYGRILEQFLAEFPRRQLLVIFTDELQQTPQRVVDQVCEFLEVPTFEPPNLGKKYHVGGGSDRFPGLLPAVRRIRPLRALFRLLPLETRRAILFWYRTETVIARDPGSTMDEAQRHRLCGFYRPDVARLERLIGRPVPWPDLTAGGDR